MFDWQKVTHVCAQRFFSSQATVLALPQWPTAAWQGAGLSGPTFYCLVDIGSHIG
jgi:hypothetical protein